MNDIRKEDKRERLLKVKHDFLREIEYKVVETRDELEDAFALVHKEYLNRGYVRSDSAKLRLSIYSALPQTTTFVAKKNERVVATVTLIIDSTLGLPMNSIYKEELDSLRRQGRRIAEVSMLASDTELLGKDVSLMLNSRKLFMIFSLFKILFDYAREIAEIQDLCIAVNPKHDLTYKFLFFEKLGDLKEYKSVEGSPAVAKRLDLTTVEEKCKGRSGLCKMFIVNQTEVEKLTRKLVMNPSDLLYFFKRKTDILEKTATEDIDYLKKCYPSYDFNLILSQ